MIPQTDIIEFFDRVRIPATAKVFILDEQYVAPSEHWVRNVFPREFEAFKRNIQKGFILDWTEEDFDCENFALLAVSYASILHKATRNRREPRAGLLFGEFYYEQGHFPFENHAINVAIVAAEDNHNLPRLLFFEPQDSSILQLTQEEIESCLGARF
jgi:hypothetical protein